MKHRVTIPGVFRRERGGTLRDVAVEVRTWGRHRHNATLVCHALTGDANADEWWSGLFTRGRILDPADRFVVSMNVLGSCYGTTGPTSVPPGELAPYAGDFPRVTIRDMVTIQQLVLSQLGVRHLDLVLGGSMGGMQALEWAVMFPEMVGTVVPIAAGASQSAWAIGLSEAQRHAITTDPAYKHGHYSPDAPPADGLSTARMIAMVSYRSQASFATRFGREADGDGFTAQSYLRYQGTKLVDRFDANTYVTLLDAMDSHDIGRGRGPREAILRRIAARSLLIGVSTDVLYPVSEVREAARCIPGARFAILDGPNGHDTFLIDIEGIDSLIGQFLAEAPTVTEVSGRGASWA